jgi:hypothetical protein
MALISALISSSKRFFSKLHHNRHPTATTMVKGTASAQKTQNSSDTTMPPFPPCQSKKPVLKMVATKVPGRNSAVRNASVFIAALSCLEAAASWALRRLSTWEMMLCN